MCYVQREINQWHKMTRLCSLKQWSRWLITRPSIESGKANGALLSRHKETGATFCWGADANGSVVTLTWIIANACHRQMLISANKLCIGNIRWDTLKWEDKRPSCCPVPPHFLLLSENQLNIRKMLCDAQSHTAASSNVTRNCKVAH